MSDAICPRVGEPCLKHGCEFYDFVEGIGEFRCRDEITNLYLEDVGKLLNLTLKSVDQHRELMTQAYKSAYQKGATPELLKLIGVKN